MFFSLYFFTTIILLFFKHLPICAIYGWSFPLLTLPFAYHESEEELLLVIIIWCERNPHIPAFVRASDLRYFYIHSIVEELKKKPSKNYTIRESICLFDISWRRQHYRCPVYSSFFVHLNLNEWKIERQYIYWVLSTWALANMHAFISQAWIVCISIDDFLEGRMRAST